MFVKFLNDLRKATSKRLTKNPVAKQNDYAITNAKLKLTS